jgi:tricorn protease-like protein
MNKFRVIKLQDKFYLQEQFMLWWFYETDFEGDRMIFSSAEEAIQYAKRVYTPEKIAMEIITEFSL